MGIKKKEMDTNLQTFRGHQRTNDVEKKPAWKSDAPETPAEQALLAR
jgi:hypothetical protein